jgi:DNA-binding beta-propeller fold protein YncE
VVAFALVAILVAVPLVTRDSGRDSEIDPNSIGILDAESGDVTATVGLEYRPGAVASSSEAVWVTNPDVDTVTQIDPTDQEIRDRIQVVRESNGDRRRGRRRVGAEQRRAFGVANQRRHG